MAAINQTFILIFRIPETKCDSAELRHNCPNVLAAAKTQVSPHLWGKLLLDTLRTDRCWAEPRSRAEHTCKTRCDKMRNSTHTGAGRLN